MTADWYKYATGYQIYPRSFLDTNGDGIGDIQGVIEKLPYLKQLGVDFIWINPVFKSPNKDNGYDISDYQDINPEYGTLDDVRELVDEAHALGLKVLFDLVVNHTSDKHPWFCASRSSKDNHYRDFYHWVEGREDCPPNNWKSFKGESAWTYDETTQSYYLHIFDKSQPDLNWKNPKLRQAIYDMIQFWFDFGIDGFRLDAISHLQKAAYDRQVTDWEGDGPWAPFMNVEGIKTYMTELKSIFDANGALTVGEASGVRSPEASSWTGDGGYMTMIFEWEHNARDVDNHGSISDFMAVLNRWQKDMDPDGWCGLYLENHDIPRIVQSFGDGFVAASKAFAVAYFLLRGTPFIYQGQEIAMSGLHFTELSQMDSVTARDVKAHDSYIEKGLTPQEALDKVSAWSRDHARSPMQWDDSPQAGFSKVQPWLMLSSNYSERNVKKALTDKNSTFYLYQKLIALRHESELIAEGHYYPIDEGNTAVFAYQRVLEDRELLVMANLTKHTALLKLPDSILENDWQEIDLGQDVSCETLTKELSLPAYAYHVFEKRQ